MDFITFLEECKKTVRAPVRDRITAEAHPELHGKIVELCRKAEISLPGDILIIENAFGIPNAGMNGKTLLLGENLLQTFGYQKYKYSAGLRFGIPKAPASVGKELEAIIAHELGHSTRMGKDKAIVMGSMFAPLVLFTGYKIYEYAKHRKEKRGGTVNQHIEIASKELEQSFDKKPLGDVHEADHKTKKFFVKAAKNAALLVAAQLVVLPFTKLGGRNVEFAADAFGGKLVGNEHMASALQKLEEAGSKAMSVAGMPPFIQKMIRVFDYHPSLASRITRLGR